MVAMGELLVFAQKAGADPEKVIQAIKSGAAQCWALDIKPSRLFKGNREPGFKAFMQAKDMNIVMEFSQGIWHSPAVHSFEHPIVQCIGRNGYG